MTGKSGSSGWVMLAACRGSDNRLFELTDEDSKITNKRRFLMGERICATCPVINQCWSGADDDDKLWTMRGGAWPEAYENPPALREPVKALECKNGHDTSSPDARLSNGTCRACHKESKKRSEAKRGSRKRGDRNATRAPRVLVCLRGHDTSKPEHRDSRGDCKKCANLRRSARHQTSKRAKLGLAP